MVLGIGLAGAHASAAEPAKPGAQPPGTASPAAVPADAPAAETPADEATRQGRDAFRRGVALARDEQWGDALVAFEEAAAARDAPIVRFNVAYCLRALGRYVAAREAVARVLADPAGLAPVQLEEAKAYAAEFETLLVRVQVTLDPPSALLTVDGRPLVPAREGGGAFLAGVAPAGAARALGKRQIEVVLDPGAHLFRAARPGHQDAVMQKSYRPGEKAKLDLRLDVLPANVLVKSKPPQGIVRVDGREVGLAPADFQRPAGQYQLEVVLDGYESYTASLKVHAGQRVDLTAELVPYERPIYEIWWFWTTAAAVVGGGVVLTYFLARPEPVPPPYDGGGTGWVVQPQGMRF